MVEEQRVTRFEDGTHDFARGHLLGDLRLHAPVGKCTVAHRYELLEPAAHDVEAGRVVPTV